MQLPAAAVVKILLLDGVSSVMTTGGEARR